VFRERARGHEFLDDPDADPRLVEEGYRFMRTVNRIGGGIAVVRRFLEHELAGSANSTPVTVLDIGAGDCDIPLSLQPWAVRRGYNVQFTCLDQNPRAIELAQQAADRGTGRDLPGRKRSGGTGRAPPIISCVGWGLPHQRNSGGAGPTLQALPAVRTVQADIFRYQPQEKFDYAMGSMTFHHFTDDEIDRLIAHLQGFVRRALLINDLHRCLLNYLVCFLLALPLDREIRHDGLLSIRRGFKPRELARMLARHDPAPTVTRHWFCRIAGVVRFDGRGHVQQGV
jgi:hypothetical protein